MNRLKLSVAVALALASSQALALGLGPIQVKSKMNEPLSADIAVIEGEADEATGLKAQLASADDMKRVGIDTSGLSVPLTFSVVPGAKGRTVIHVSSNDAVRDPFVSFLLEVNWGKGRVLREYNVLLDPPVSAPTVVGTRAVAAPLKEAERAPAKPVAPVETKPAPAPAAAPAVAATPEPAKPAAKPAAPAKPEAKAEAKAEAKPEAKPAAPSQPAPAPVAAGGDYGPVASGETLWEIAARTRPERAVGVNQMMVALLNANPQAFYRDNVNALKRGAVLRIPGSDEVRKLSSAEAAAAVTAQNQAWAGGTAAPPVKVADSGKPSAAPSAAPAPAAAAAKSSRLELVPPKAGTGKSGADKPGAAGGTDTSAVRADLMRVKEQLTSKEQEATELRSRVSDLEKIKADNDKLISLKNSQIAELQQKLAELNRQIDQQKRELAKVQAAPAKPEAAPAKAEPPKPELSKPEPSKPEPVVPAVTATPPATAAKPEVTPSVVPPAATPAPAEASKAEATEPKVTPLAESKPAKPVPMPETPAVPPPSTEAWFENPLLLGGVGILLILGAGALFLSRRRKPEPEPEPAEMEAPSLGDQFAGGPFGGAAAAPVLSADDEERALLEQLALDPTDEDSHLDLLRTYYLRNDADKFEHAAHAFYAQHPSAMGWQRAAEMGRELMPDNMLFAHAAAAPEDAGEAAFAEAAADPATRHDLDFDFGLAEKDENVATAAEAEPVKFDFDITPPPPSRVRPEPEPESEAEFESTSLDSESVAADEFRLEGEPEHPDAASEATQAIAAPDFDFTLETPKPTPAATRMSPDFMGEDAVGTKLDLARAYLDMGDPDGARSMLQEVLSEGSTAQQDEARKLLTELG